MAIGNKDTFLNVYFSLPERVKHILFFTLLRSFYLASAGIYVPLFILDRLGLSYAILFFVLQYGVFCAISAIIVRELLKSKSIEFLQMLSLFFIFGQLLSLNLFYDERLVVAAGLFGALGITFYWIPQHLAFGVFGRRRELAKEYAAINMPMIAIMVVFPVVAGIIINAVSYGVFFLIFSIIALSFAILAMRHFKARGRIKVGKSKSTVKRKFALLFASEGLWFSFYIMVDILVYTLIKNLLIFGILKSLVMLFAAFTAFLISKRIDKRHDYALATIGILLKANVFTVLFLSLNSVTAAAAMLLFGLIAPLIDTPFYGFLYNMVKKYGYDVICLREFILGISRAIGLSLFFFLDFSIAMGIAVLCGILFGFMYYFISIKEEIRELT